MREINEINIHCSATQPDWMEGQSISAKIAEIRRWHVARKFSDIGYHFLIDRDGTIGAGRPVTRMGAHIKGRNERSIGICLLGGHGSNEMDAFEEHFTPQQDDALRGLISELQGKYGITRVEGHNKYAAKACPGFQVDRWFRRKPPARENVAQSTTIQATAGSILASSGGAVAAVGSLDGTVQIVVIVAAAAVLLLGMWIMRERLKQWARGVR